MKAPELLNVEIPKAALCGFTSRGKHYEGHAAVAYTSKRGGKTHHQFWRCSVCMKILTWETPYGCYISKYTISEEPW